MQLKGSLKEHSVIELLSSMGKERCTGILILTQGKENVQIHWEQGKIVQVFRKALEKQFSFGQMMVDIGQITPNELEQALIQQRRKLSPLGELLTKIFRCEQSKILLVLRVQAIEKLYSLLFWKKGQFRFESLPVSIPKHHFELIETDSLVREAIPVVDAWSRIKGKFRSPLVEIQLVRPLTRSSKNELTKNEEIVYDIIETGNIRYRELSILSGLGQFVTGYVLQNLQQQKIVVFKLLKHKAIDLSRLFFGGTLGQFGVWVMATILLIAGATYLLAFSPHTPFAENNFSFTGSMEGHAFHQKIEVWKKTHLYSVLQFYYQRYGFYPKNLDSLIKEGWLQKEQLLSFSGKKYFYKRLSKKQYRLLRPL